MVQNLLKKSLSLGRSVLFANPAQQRSFARPLTVLLLSLTMAASSFAGYYRVTYSATGTAESIGPLGTYHSENYTNTSDGGRGGSALTADYFSGGLMGAAGRPGWTKCSGTITATFTWVPAYSGEPTPKTLIVRQKATAVAGGDVGTADNGLGDSPTFDGDGTWTSTGTHFEKITDPASSFTRTCSPSAEETVFVPGTYPDLMAGTSYCYYQAAAFAVQLTFIGLLDNETGVIGSSTSAAIVINPSKYGASDAYSHSVSTSRNSSTYSWTVAGETFKTFTHSASSGHAVSLSAGDLLVESPVWCWKAIGTNPVSGTVTATFDSVHTTSITGNRTINVVKPTYDLWASGTGDSRYGVNGSGVVGGVTSSTASSGVGIIYHGYATDPFYGSLTYTGTWELIQLVNSSRSWDGGGTGKTINTGGSVYDDGAGFPYPVSSGGAPISYATADGTNYISNDTPTNPCTTSLSVTDSFKMYMLFKPSSGQFTPLAYIPWTWSVSCSGSGVYTNWSPTPPGATASSSKVATTTHPDWSSKVSDYLPSGGPGGPPGGPGGGSGGGAGGGSEQLAIRFGSLTIPNPSTLGIALGNVLAQESKAVMTDLSKPVISSVQLNPINAIQLAEANQSFDQGRRALRDKNLALAEQMFSAALQFYPEHKGAMKLLADVYFKRGKNGLALQTYRSLIRDNTRAMSLSQSDPEVLAAYGELSFQKGDFAEARFAFTEAIGHSFDMAKNGMPTTLLKGSDLNSLRASALMGAAAEAFYRNHGADAEMWARKALAARPGWEEAQFYLGFFLRHQVPGKPEQALVEFKKLANSSNPAIRKLVSQETSGLGTGVVRH